MELRYVVKVHDVEGCYVRSYFIQHHANCEPFKAVEKLCTDYPDAAVYANRTYAYNIAREATKRYPYSNIYVYRNYGFENEVWVLVGEHGKVII